MTILGVVVGILQIGAWGSIWGLLFIEVLLQLPCRSRISELNKYRHSTSVDAVIQDLGEPRDKLVTSLGFGIRYTSRLYYEVCSDIPITIYLDADERVTGVRLGRHEPRTSLFSWVLMVNSVFMLGWLGAMLLARNDRRYVLPQSSAVAAMLILDTVFMLPDLIPLAYSITSALWLLVASALLMLIALVQVIRVVANTSDIHNQETDGGMTTI